MHSFIGLVVTRMSAECVRFSVHFNGVNLLGNSQYHSGAIGSLGHRRNDGVGPTTGLESALSGIIIGVMFFINRE